MEAPLARKDSVLELSVTSLALGGAVREYLIVHAQFIEGFAVAPELSSPFEDAHSSDRTSSRNVRSPSPRTMTSTPVPGEAYASGARLGS